MEFILKKNKKIWDYVPRFGQKLKKNEKGARYLNFIASNENQSSTYVNGPDAEHEHYINAMYKLTRYVDKKNSLQYTLLVLIDFCPV